MDKKIMVYTSIIGKYDTLQNIKKEENVDYYCFTDDTSLKSDVWKIIYIDNKEHLDNTRMERKIKILGDKALEKKYDLIVYTDANIEMHKSIKEFIKKECDLENYDMFFLKHHERNCIYKEAKECIRLKKDYKIDIERTIEYLKNANYPENFGLTANSFFIRKSNNKKIDKVFFKWWDVVKNYSKRDQLSFMYCIWKEKYKKLQQLEVNMIDNKYFEVHSHLKNEKEFFMGNRNSNFLGNYESENKYDSEEYCCKIDDINDSHASIARRIANNSKVLDVGCATGLIGKLLKENKNCVITGIEYDRVSASISKKSGYYKNVFNFSITCFDDAIYKKFLKDKEKYDYIVFADVLEHTTEPWKIIDIFAKKLNKNGKILISIPNIAHIDIIRGLINKNFNYNNTGILDSTHLRFFTAKSFIDMIENYNKIYENNFSIEYFDKTYVKPSYIDEEKLYSYFGDDEYFVVQNLFELTLVDSKYDIQYINVPKEEDDFKNIGEYIYELQKQIKEQEKLLVTINTQIKEQEKEILDLENQNKELKKNQTYLQEQNKEMEKTLDLIYNSNSWKFTSNIRNIYHKLLNRGEKNEK